MSGFRRAFVKCEILIFFLCICSGFAKAQDTLCIMHHNALYYGVTTGFCSQSNNNLMVKNVAFKVLAQYAKPDILNLNEMSSTAKIQDTFLQKVLNTDGITHYRKAPPTNKAKSNIVNVVFYNTQKVELYKTKIIPLRDTLRDITAYKFYHLNDKLEKGDTIFFTCIVGHLKAGQGKAEDSQRKAEVEDVMTWLNDQPDIGNYFFMGDFNLYSCNDPAYETMIFHPNENVKLYDPIAQEGDWHDNPDYSLFHTQSTHDIQGCTAGGGLDDRFDFIMFNKFLKTGELKMKYLEGSYMTIGNDGSYLNKAINNTENNLLFSSEITNAAYDASDHLPIKLLVVIPEKYKKTPSPITSSINKISKEIGEVQLLKLTKNKLEFTIKSATNKMLLLTLDNISGKRVLSKNIQIETGKQLYEFPVKLIKGAYIFRLTDKKGNNFSEKLMVK